MNILFVISVLFGCYSTEAIDDVISSHFDETEMMERLEDKSCFYGWHEGVAIDRVYKRFLWEDGDKMVVLHGLAPDKKDILFWMPLSKYEKMLNRISV